MTRIFYSILAIIQITVLTAEANDHKFRRIHQDTIEWSDESDWVKIMEKAKKEQKYIFIDCYATWCLPCKLMDQKVYTNDTLASYMNANFICVKLQVDTSKNDDIRIKEKYAVANSLKRQYSVNEMPTFLFFSSDGTIVHRGMGGLDVQQMLSLAANALDSSKQYYHLRERFIDGNIDAVTLDYLARTAKQLGDDIFASQVAARYANVFLNQLPEDSLLTKDVISFIGTFPENLKLSEKLVRLCHNRSSTIDSLMFPGFAKSVISYIIERDYLTPFLKSNSKSIPSAKWYKLEQDIRYRFGQATASLTIVNFKPDFYKEKKDWKNYVQSIIDKIGTKVNEKYNTLDAAYDLNNYAWEVFMYSKSNHELTQALNWSNRAITLAAESLAFKAGCLDTKANILYKLGHKADAIMVEMEAIRFDPNESAFKGTLQKMKNGEPTWK